MFAKLSLILTYTLESSLGRFYHDWLLAPDSIFQQAILPILHILNARVPYSLFFNYLYHALSLPFHHLRHEVLTSPIGQVCITWLMLLQGILQSFPKTLAFFRLFIRCTWLAVSTPVAAFIWTIRYYFDHVTDPNLRFLFAALLALGAYGLLVLGVWYWVLWYSIDVNMRLLRFSLTTAERILRRLVLMMEGLLGSLKKAIRHVQAGLFALLAMSHWFARILSLLVLVVVDRFIDAIDETNKLQSQVAASRGFALMPAFLPRIARKVVVYVYIGYVARQSIVTFLGWLLSFDQVRGAFSTLRQVLAGLLTLSSKLGTALAGLICPIVRVATTQLATWLYGFSVVKLAVFAATATFGPLVRFFGRAVVFMQSFINFAASLSQLLVARWALTPLTWLLKLAMIEVSWNCPETGSPETDSGEGYEVQVPDCPCYEGSCLDCTCHDSSCSCVCHGQACGCNCHDISCDCHCHEPPPKPNPRFFYLEPTSTVPGDFSSSTEVDCWASSSSTSLRRSPRLQASLR